MKPAPPVTSTRRAGAWAGLEGAVDTRRDLGPRLFLVLAAPVLVAVAGEDVPPQVAAGGAAGRVHEHAQEVGPGLGQLRTQAGHQAPLLAHGPDDQHGRIAPV